MESSLATLLLWLTATVSGIQPNEGFRDVESDFENDIGSENLPVFGNTKLETPDVARVVKSPREGLTLDEMASKLHAKVSAVARERANGGVPAKSMKELEELMSHPTWLTDTSNKRGEPAVMSKSRRVFVVPASGEKWSPHPETDDQKDHIRDVINKFRTLVPKQPITDNRMTKFVFTHDTDIATSRTVQEHNKEVEVAFMDFNKKLEETLNGKSKKMDADKSVQKESPDRNLNRVVSFLDQNIHRLKEESAHRPMCRNNKSRNKDNVETADFKKTEDETDDIQRTPMKRAGMLRFNELAQTRDSLENALLGLDRPRSYPYKRHVPLKFRHLNRPAAKSHQKKPK